MASDFEMMEKSARKMAASVDRAKTAAAKKAARQQVADRLASTAAQRGMAGPAAAKMLGRLSGAAGIGITAAEIAQALRKKKKAGEESSARASRLAADSASKSIKVKPGQSPTDAMRATSKGRQVLDSANRAASKYTVKSGDTLSEIAKAKGTTVRAIMKASGIKNADKINVGQKIVIPDDVKRKGPYGKKQFMYKGKPSTTRTKEEEVKAKAKAKPNKPKTKATPKAKKAMRVGKPGYNRRTIEKAMGGSMGSKPKGVGCASRGYGKAMKK